MDAKRGSKSYEMLYQCRWLFFQLNILYVLKMKELYRGLKSNGYSIMSVGYKNLKELL